MGNNSRLSIKAIIAVSDEEKQSEMWGTQDNMHKTPASKGTPNPSMETEVDSKCHP